MALALRCWLLVTLVWVIAILAAPVPRVKRCHQCLDLAAGPGLAPPPVKHACGCPGRSQLFSIVERWAWHKLPYQARMRCTARCCSDRL
jgi:hypothetical protein